MGTGSAGSWLHLFTLCFEEFTLSFEGQQVGQSWSPPECKEGEHGNTRSYKNQETGHPTAAQTKSVEGSPSPLQESARITFTRPFRRGPKARRPNDR